MKLLEGREFPGNPFMRSPSCTVSSLLSAIGRISISLDMVAWRGEFIGGR
jgi:hypothetical protein